jgi:hypothetical protein
VDIHEARGLLADSMRAYRKLPYAALVLRIGHADAKQMLGPSGAFYQLEFQAFWDDAPHRNVRVVGSVDDGRFLSSLKPLCDDFIKSPNGAFVGENES